MKLWLLLLLPAATPALAQTTYHLGVRGGLNRATTTLDVAANTPSSSGRLRGHSTSNSTITAWQAGAVLEIRRGWLALQPSLLFTQKGEQFAYAAYDSPVNSSFQDAGTVRTNWLELPIDLAFTPLGDHGPQLFAGPYAALVVGGHQNGTRSYVNSPSAYRAGDYRESITYGSDGYNHRFDAGLRAGLGYRQGPVQVQVLYSWGLTNLHQASASPDVLFRAGTTPGYPDDMYHEYRADAARNRVLQLTGTYFFDL